MNLIERRRQMMMSKSLPSEPNYLRFTALEDSSSVMMKKQGTPPNHIFEYRINGVSWESVTFDVAINLDEGDYIEIRNARDTVYSTIQYGTSYYYFVMTGEIEGSGNIMSLLDKTCQSVKVGKYGLEHLFQNCISLKTPPRLPATIFIDTHCYNAMFQSSGITYSPELPATQLTANCYQNLFYNCASMSTSSYMRATTLSGGCYSNLYRGTAVTNARFATLNDSTYLFLSSNSIEYIIIEDENVPIIGANTINGLKASCIIYVPDESVEAYKAAQYWSNRANYIKGISEKPVS